MVSIKLLFAVAVLVAGALGGAIPLWRRGEAAGGTLVGLGNALAAGVFLGAGLIHMLPDAAAAWSALGWEYPVAFLLAAAAFVLLLLFEHVLLPDSAHRAVHAPSSERFAHLPAPAHSGVAAYALLAALSIHAFLAGLALGAQSALGAALVIFVAIAAHKSIAGFALGVSLARMGMPSIRAWSLLWVFATATPLGILVGALLGEALEGSSQRSFEASFLALAAGTFAYVATLDILRDEFHEPGGRFAKWGCVAGGVALMALLALWV